MSDERPLPILTDHNRPFWQAAADHKLVMPCCNACGKVFFPIGPVCPDCFSQDLGWKQVSGRGKVSSFVVYRQAFFAFYKDRIPYAVAQIELEEGPRYSANVFGIPAHEVRIGMDVEVTFEKVSDEVTLPQFQPRANSSAGGAASR